MSRRTERRGGAPSVRRRRDGSVGYTVTGRVVSGLGQGRRFTSLRWLQRQFREKVGFVPAPGTLNLEAKGVVWAAVRRRLRRSRGIPITPPPGFCEAKCFRASLSGALEAAVVLPVVPGYPANKLELVAADSIRRRLDLSDGDGLRVRIFFDRVERHAPGLVPRTRRASRRAGPWAKGSGGASAKSRVG